MRTITSSTLFLCLIAFPAFSQIQTHPQLVRHPIGDVLAGQEPLHILQASEAPTIPAGTPDHYDQGVIDATERFHGQMIGELQQKVETLQGSANWMEGALWALFFIGAGFLTLLGRFWRAALRVMMDEVDPRILRS